MATMHRGLLGLVLLLLFAAFGARAEDDPPGRVGRIADVAGAVSIYDAAEGQWVAAARNRPLTAGDRIASDADGRAELRIGSTTLRIGAGTEIEVLRLDDERVRIQLHAGDVALRVRAPEVAAETEIVTAEAVLRPQRGGHFRIARDGESTTWASAWRGELRVTDDAGRDEAFVIDNGRRVEVWRSGGALRHDWAAAPASDAFAAWALADDARDDRAVASSRHVSPEMTGAEELDRNGSWDQHPEYGAIWFPATVQPGWAPYRYGHWAWVAPWGWTWVDDAPWGFAPFHYGRWVSWRGRWCWAPGRYVARPVYAPALVAWVGGPRGGVTIGTGAPVVGWVPLAPREPYVPWYRASPRYGDRLNRDHRDHRDHPPPRRGEGFVYANEGVQTIVPREAFLHRQPVARAVIDVRIDGRGDARPQPLERVAPPQPRAEPRPLALVPGQPARVLPPREADREPRGDRPERRIQPVRPPVPGDGGPRAVFGDPGRGDAVRQPGDRDRAAVQADRERGDAARRAEQDRDAVRQAGDRDAARAAADRDAAARQAERDRDAARQAGGRAADRDAARQAADRDAARQSAAPQAARGLAAAREAADRDAARQSADRDATRQAERDREAARQAGGRAADRDAARQAADRDAARQAAERDAARQSSDREAARQAADRDARQAAERDARQPDRNRDVARPPGFQRERDVPRPPDRDTDRGRERLRDRDAAPRAAAPPAAVAQPIAPPPVQPPAAAVQPPRPQPAPPAREAAPPRPPEQRAPEQRNPGGMRERPQVQ